ncbi:type 1 glutamine amidotransferase [Tepidimonas taiwanensis]|uniref:GMP synthase glutamine-hydrolyzing n=1 Tax=Tepidimonas taiwanensis TaxID=307486 RepID=A0A554X8H2_9BURK|nr:type 1 glutamine amidotransferase [Tepidimonas taiwanensis]MCX7693848.1 type 1 glutamine amidotransferase [Tepidimonas taiwanensis]MDM7463969.1 type 1 glutamine amidotransferase [Tepidimonas taiwanensis]TSE32128.1 GMP synthase glutamine-hydrolyzing [Tepidimonas taiwanensis]UBQ06074.1 type 1 glutamine amidotransferase [Tepidimonas taiwanensis]
MATIAQPPHAAAPHGDVLVLQHTVEDPPGYLATWLDMVGARWDVFCAEAGERYPASVAPYRALAVLGGEWSANDDRPSLRHAEALIREADALGIPVIGHCLGGQLLARALGGRVQRLPQPEIGWLPITPDGSAAAREWLGEAGDPVVYQWHYDGVVELPPGATVLAASPACAVQAYTVGPHLGMQFHIEITPLKIDAWLADPGTVYPGAVHAHPQTVQSPEAMRAATARHQAASYRLADRLYAAWQRRWRAAAVTVS